MNAESINQIEPAALVWLVVIIGWLLAYIVTRRP